MDFKIINHMYVKLEDEKEREREHIDNGLN